MQMVTHFYWYSVLWCWMLKYNLTLTLQVDVWFINNNLLKYWIFKHSLVNYMVYYIGMIELVSFPVPSVNFKTFMFI